MEFTEMMNQILYTVLTGIVPVIVIFLVRLIDSKIKESNIIADTAKNENLSRIVEGALSDVLDAVLYVNQIYTDSLKASGKFDKTAQEEAFNRSYVTAMNMISDEAKKVIGQLYGSFDNWLKLKIESSVNMAKQQEKM